jgi:hypothetical protein
VVTAGNAITGIICFIVFVAILIATWDFINYQVGYLAMGTADPMAQLVIYLLPWVIAAAGTFGCWRIAKGRFGD